MSTTFYQNLNTDKYEIRILELAPGQAEEPITMELLTVSLKNSPPPTYEALSYIWGDNTIKREITVCSTTFNVTPNLEEALLRLRLPDQTRKLWVDAICINQNDVGERENQVRIMGKIYTGCKQALVWLGPEEPGDAAGLDFIESALKGELGVARSCSIYLEDYRGDREAEKCGYAFQELGALVARPWWSRSWTLQELALAPEATLCFGNLEVNWEQLSKAKDSIQEAGPPGSKCYGCVKAKFRLELTIGWLSVLRSRAGQAELLDMVIRNRSKAATDPRDKIFAFLGLASSSASNLQPNYTATTEYLYSHFAWEDIVQRRNLCILSSAVDNDQGSLELPSWVSDWSCNSRRPDEFELTRIKVWYYKYDASGGQDFVGELHESESDGSLILGIDGAKIDVVSAVGYLYPDFQKTTMDEQSDVLKQWAVLSGIPSDPFRTYYPSGCTVTEAFWRTAIKDIIHGPIGEIRASRTYERSFFKAWAIFDRETSHQAALDIGDNGKDHILNQTVGEVMNALYQNQERRFVISKEGLFGNGSYNVMEGDEIWIVKGGRLPLVLRQKKENDFNINNTDSFGPLYTFVGDCYVHGIMDGERAPKDNEMCQRIFIA